MDVLRSNFVVQLHRHSRKVVGSGQYYARIGQYSILVLLLLLVACAPTEPAAVAPTQSPIVEATATIASVPTNAPTNTVIPVTDTAMPATDTAMPATATVDTPTDVPPTATEVVSTYDGMPQGFTEAGAPALGNADADVEMIDYSDFL